MNHSENLPSSKSALDFKHGAVAYLRPVSTAQGAGFAVCNADGNQLAVFATREAAFFAARQHDLEPVLLH